MAEIYDWETGTGATFNDAEPPDGWPELMAPSAVNNVGREMMAVIARWRESAESCTLTGGTAPAYTLTVPQTITSLSDGMRFAFCAHASCPAGAATLAVNGLSEAALIGSRTVVDGSPDIDLYAGEILEGFVYIVAYLDGQFIILNPTITDQAGVVPLDRIPATLTGKDAVSVGGFAISSDPTGSETNTIYFRTS